MEKFYLFQQLPEAFRRSEFLQLRSRSARFFLSSLDAANSSGPDGLSIVFLKNIASVLGYPFAHLARRIL